jgi:hypothetical protein
MKGVGMHVFSIIKRTLFPKACMSADLANYEPKNLKRILESSLSKIEKRKGIFPTFFTNAIEALAASRKGIATFGQLHPCATEAVVREIAEALSNVTLCDWHLGDYNGRQFTEDRFGKHYNRGYVLTPDNRKLFHFTGYISSFAKPITSYIVAVCPAQMLAITMRLRDAAAWIESDENERSRYESETYITNEELHHIRMLIPQIPHKTWEEHDGAGEQRQGHFVDFDSRHGPVGICQMGYDADESERCATSTYLVAVMPKNVEGQLNLIASIEHRIHHAEADRQSKILKIEHQEQGQ